MQLPLSYLLFHLRQFLELFREPEDGCDFLMNPPFFYNGEDLLKSGSLCLCRSFKPDRKLKMELGSVLLCSSPSPFPASENVFLIRQSVSDEAVSNLLHQLFSDAANWESRLASLALNRAPLTELLQTGAEYLKKPLGIMNPEFHIVASYGDDAIPDEANDKQKDSDDMTSSAVNSLKNDSLYKEVEQYRKPFLYPSGSLSLRSLCINLFYKETYAGRLTAIEWGDLIRPWDGCFLSILGKYVLPLYLEEQNSGSGNSRRRLLTRRLLEGAALSEQDFFSLLREMNWPENGSYLCACISPSEADFANHTLDYFARNLERQLPGTLCAAFDEKIGVLANLKQYTEGRSEFEGCLVYSIREANFRAGLSRVFRNLPEASFAYHQAGIALEMGLRRNPQRWKHTFDEHVLSYLFQICTRELPARFVCCPALLLLRQRDRETGSDYCHTLKTWLEHGQNTVQTAKDLFIHRGTLIYRLDKITEMTGLDLNSWQTQLYLLLSFQLLENPVSQ